MIKNEPSGMMRWMRNGFGVSAAGLLMIGALALAAVPQTSTLRAIEACVFSLLAFLLVLFLRLQSRITASVAAEDALEKVMQPLLKVGALQDAIFKSANFSSIATDVHGVIQIFNVGAERMLGYKAAEVVDKITPVGISDEHELIARAATLSDELGTSITPGFEAMVCKAARGIEDIYELTYIRKDFSRFPAIVSVTALRDAEENLIGYLLIGTDNTARKRVEAEQALLDHALQQSNVELAQAKAAAEKANLAKSEFLSSMSHELRTPLNAVLGFAQLMASDTPPPSAEQKMSIDQILQAGWYLLRLINEILDLAMIESGKVTMSHESVSLTELLRDCQAMIEPQAQGRGIQMRFPDFADPYFVHADRTRVKQIIINLLSNAIKYNRAGGSVIIACEKGEDERVMLRVTDTGAGLSQAKLDQLFQPFNRLGQENGAEEGTGIGLVVTRQLVELMRGEIGVESEVGIGSTFWVALPAASAPELAFDDADMPQAAQHELAPGAVRRTLLYVEDNPANLALVEQLIARRSDLKLLTAIDGHIGVQLARTFKPDVILMDINLPGISGFGALKILQEDAGTRRIPVIALSANAVPRDIEKGLDAGFFRYLTKPIKVNEFMDALDVALHHAADQGPAGNGRRVGDRPGPYQQGKHHA